MPVYEFYCRKCNTVYNFFSRSVNTEKTPLCPSCKKVRLKRQMSLFANISGGKGETEAGEEGMPPLDESKMEKAMAMLAREAGAMNEDDPRQAAMLMRKLTEATGIAVGPGMEEALNRLEKGEDPDRIEEEMGDILAEEEPLLLENKRRKSSRHSKPRVDETLYEL